MDSTTLEVLETIHRLYEGRISRREKVTSDHVESHIEQRGGERFATLKRLSRLYREGYIAAASVLPWSDDEEETLYKSLVGLRLTDRGYQALLEEGDDGDS